MDYDDKVKLWTSVYVLVGFTTLVLLALGSAAVFVYGLLMLVGAL